MTKVPGIKYQEVGNLYGLRNWVEYGLKQSKNELGWSDFRFTNYSRIEKWWEMVMSAFLMVSLQSENLNRLKLKTWDLSNKKREEIQEHPWWSEGLGWKNILNNLRLFLQPWSYFNLLKPWLVVIFKHSVIRSFTHLFAMLQQTVNSFIETIFPPSFYHSFT
jgi:hypothetical protein